MSARRPSPLQSVGLAECPGVSNWSAACVQAEEVDERLWGAQDEKEDTEQAEGTDDRRTKVPFTTLPCF